MSRRKIKSLFGKFLLSFGSESELLERDFSHRLQDIEKEMEERVKYFKSQNKYIEAQRIEERTNFDIEMMKI